MARCARLNGDTVRLTVDGRSAYAATGGRPFDATAPVVVLVHGAGFDHTSWVLQTRYLAHRGFAVLAVDLPGHGSSDGPTLASVDAMADWLIRFLDGAGVTTAALVGHSMGALAALAAASRHPDRVDRIALVGSADAMPVHPALLEAAATDLPHAAALIAGWSVSGRAQFAARVTPGTRLLDTCRRILERSTPGVLASDLAACDALGPTHAIAARVTCPALVVAGSQDKMTSFAGSRRLQEALPDGRIVEVAGAGHMLMLEAPDAVLDALVGFLGED